MKQFSKLGLVATSIFFASSLFVATTPVLAKANKTVKYAKWEVLGKGFMGRAKKVDKKLALARLKENEAFKVGIDVPIYALWLETGEAGFYSAPIADLAAKLGVRKKAMRKFARQRKISLTNAGEQQAWYFDQATDSIQFFAKKNETFYTDKNAYQLSISQEPLTVIDNAKVKAPKNARTGVAFTETLHLEEDNSWFYFYAVEPGEHDADFWGWVASMGGDSKEVSLTIPDSASADFHIKVSIRGLTDSDKQAPNNVNDHDVTAYLNGVEIGRVSWDGMRLVDIEGDVSLASIPSDGVYTLKLESAKAAHGKPTFQSLDEVHVTYPRLPIAQNGKILMRGLSQGKQTVRGFATDQILVIENPGERTASRFIDNTLIESDGVGYRVSFKIENNDSSYLVVEEKAIATIDSGSIRADIPSSLTDKKNRADYLIIAPRIFGETAKDLKKYRQGQFGKVKIAWLDDIYEVFSFGRVDPFAITRFMNYVDRKWKIKPSMVVIVGNGTMDHKGRLGMEDSFVPVVMTETSYEVKGGVRETLGLYPSDDRLLGVGADDGSPFKFAVGRIPIVTDSQGMAYVKKIQFYESSVPPIEREATLISGEVDLFAGDFDANMDLLGERLTNDLKGDDNPNDHGFAENGSGIDKLYHSVYGSGLKSALKADQAWNKDLVVYDGHGAWTGLGTGQFSTPDLVAQLTNQKLPIFTALSCTIAHFGVPGVTDFSSSLIFNYTFDSVGNDENGNPIPSSVDENGHAIPTSYGGAIAVMGPTARSFDSDAKKLGNYFVDSMYEYGNNKSIGEATRSAKLSLQGQARYEFMPRVYMVLGDPAIKPL